MFITFSNVPESFLIINFISFYWLKQHLDCGSSFKHNFDYFDYNFQCDIVCTYIIALLVLSFIQKLFNRVSFNICYSYVSYWYFCSLTIV
jgi:hypothetical protein